MDFIAGIGVAIFLAVIIPVRCISVCIQCVYEFVFGKGE